MIPILVILCILMVIRLIFVIRKKIREKKGKNTYKKSPKICPHCKNPITKNLPECEWCGNKIC